MWASLMLLAAKSRQSCPTLCNPIDGSPPDSHPWDSPGNNTGVGCHFLLQCMKVKSESEVTHLCPTLCHSMDCSLPGSSVHGISQARALEWGAIAFSTFLMAQMVKSLPAMQETRVQFLGGEDLIEKGMDTHSHILAWRIPWREEPSELYSPWDHKVRHY